MVLDPLLPDPAWLAGRGGRPERHCRRQVVDAIFYLVDNGTKWRALPVDFPPWSTVYKYFAAWEAAGFTQDVLEDLRVRVRLAEGRVAQPSAALVDSQSVKAAETVACYSRGFDAGKKINGRRPGSRSRDPARRVLRAVGVLHRLADAPDMVPVIKATEDAHFDLAGLPLVRLVDESRLDVADLVLVLVADLLAVRAIGG